MDTEEFNIGIEALIAIEALGRYFQRSRLGQYVIAGQAGEPKNIALDRSYVTWDDTPTAQIQ